jgi:hypothetical protein
MIKEGRKYLATDPERTSGAVIDLHRIWAPYVHVEVVKVHRLRIRNRYVVKTDGGIEFSTGRLLPIKQKEGHSVNQPG